jgi:hypothetical protein
VRRGHPGVGVPLATHRSRPLSRVADAERRAGRPPVPLTTGRPPVCWLIAPEASESPAEALPRSRQSWRLIVRPDPTQKPSRGSSLPDYSASTGHEGLLLKHGRGDTRCGSGGVGRRTRAD